MFYFVLFSYVFSQINCDLYTPPLPERVSSTFTSPSKNNSISLTYHKKKQICCDGRVYSQPDIYSYVACCGSSQYSINKEVCCSDIIYPIKTNHVCCGSKYHNPRETACCYHPYTGDAFLVLIAPGTEEYVLCCGIRAYDTRTHICCTMEVSEFGPIRPSSNQFVDRVTRFIVYDRKYKHSACCKGKAYDAESGACSDIQLTSRSLWTRLRPDRTHPIGICGHNTYDTKMQWCCSGVEKSQTVYRISSLPCCGFVSYDQETHVCCGGVVHVQNEFGSLLCCGKGGVYDGRHQECCDNSFNVIPLRHLTHRGDMCCGTNNSPYHSYRQACCANTVIDVPQSIHGDYRCCINTERVDQVVLYLRDEEICCNGAKYLLSVLYTHCCGQLAYSPDKMLCCDGKLHVKNTLYDSCCGPNPYNGQSYVCCGREEWSAMKRNPEKRKCCLHQRPHQFDRVDEHCECDVSEPQIYPRLAKTNACCKLQVYDSRTHKCCAGLVIDRYLKLCCLVAVRHSWEPMEYVVDKRSFNSDCCGKAPYNPQSQICCNNSVVAWMGLDDLGCCGSIVYDRQKQMCCDLMVREKKMGSTACCGDQVFDPTKEMCCEQTRTILKVSPGDELVTGCCFKE